ncbi:hypothetical protein OG342_22470 [Streptomyces bobili]|uniref:AbiTii domain-containing protein n=1 Tax=Streptomyces bobili TaxID=67280 RepID=UPI002255B560|nr:hypothetical protein [Streptomyces bobili]MCX5525583.1 hypothetical protein [Streptomyces bobili]
MAAEERAHALELAEELLADIELDRLPLDKQLLKGARLARLVGDERFSMWIGKELSGYGVNDVDGYYWKRTKRNVGDGNQVPYAGAAHIVTVIGPLEEELKNLRLPNVSGEWAATALRETRSYINSVRNLVAKHQHVITAVRNLLHEFTSKHFYSLRFSMHQGEMFETAKANIDKILEGMPGDALRKLDSAYVNITAGDPESIAGAMNSVRRLIDAVADAVFPATDETRTDGQGNQIKLGNQQRLNRIKAHVDDHVDCKGRGDRLKRAVSDIYGRVSSGVHNDVATSEASYLFLSAYVLLGEIVSLPSEKST